MRAIVAAMLMLGACAPAAPDVSSREGAPLDAVRLEMPAAQAPPAPRASDAVAAWQVAADGSQAGYGYAGEVPLVALSCRSGVLVITRNAPASSSAGALFALTGNLRVLRLPVDATLAQSGRGFVWQGTLAPDDQGTEVFFGADIKATLPGAGMIEMPGGEAPQSVIKRCRGNPATAAPISTASSD